MATEATASRRRQADAPRGTSRPPTVLVGGVLLAVALLVAWLLGRAVVQQARELERRTVDQEARRAVHALLEEAHVLEGLVRDWASWDDSYRFVKDGNQAFVRANLTWESLAETTRVHLVAFLDDAGRLAWGGFRSPDYAQALPLPAGLADAAPQGHSGFHLTAQGPLTLAAMPILQSDGSGPPRGTLVMGRFLDEPALHRLRDRTSPDLEVRDTLRWPPAAAERTRLWRLRTVGHEVEYAAEQATVHAFVPALAGRGGLRVTLPLAREVFLQGLGAGRKLSSAVFLALGGAGMILLLGFRWYVRTVEANRAELERLVAQRTAALSEANRSLEEASTRDALTGLRNRRFVHLTLPQDVSAVARALAGRGRPAPPDPPADVPGAGEELLFFLVDLDHFKAVNDTHGHAAGDAVLRQVGELLRSTFRESDLVARWGGEEFLVVARRTHRSFAPLIATKLLEAFRQHLFTLPGGETLRRTCSVGWCPFPLAPSLPRAVDWTQVLEVADHALFAAKRGGRDAWVGADAADGVDPARLAARLSAELVALVEEGALTIRCSRGDPAELSWIGP